ncbi:hypothetical protein BASA81_008371 [Batrachochytrium salamandrivorans]|nr:hypothetical protein BASA81_008371 [Batrachochytrium salamandrivorans]
MFAVSGQFSKSVSLEANKITVLSLVDSTQKNQQVPAIVFEVDATLQYACLEFSPFAAMFALASESNVQVFDASNGNLLFTLPVENTCSVAFSGPTSLLSANSVDGTVTETLLLPSAQGDGKPNGSFVGDKKGLHSICFGMETGLVAAAKNKIYVFDQKAEYKCVSKFTGHDSPVVAMRFLSNDGELVSCNGKEIFVWPSAGKNRKAVAPLFQLKLESREVSMLHVGPALQLGSSSFMGSVLAVWPGGEARIWQIPSGEGGEGEDGGVLAGSTNLSGVLAADFGASAVHGSVLCLPSSACEELVLVPLFEQKGKKQLLRGEVDVLEGVSANLALATAVTKVGDKLQQRVARVDHSQPTAQPKRLRKDSQVDEEEDERPLLSRLQDYSNRLSLTPSAAELALAAMPATTLSVTLEQALQTEEREKIEAVLQNTDLVTATVQKLHVNKLSALLRELLSRFVMASSPARYDQLLLWLNSILELHGEFLSTSPECKAVLGEIYKVNESRVLSFASLFRLKGKLDFTLTRCSKHAPTTTVATSGPLVTVDGMVDEEE